LQWLTTPENWSQQYQPWLEPHEGQQTLGIRLVPDGNSVAEFDHQLDHTRMELRNVESKAHPQ